MSITNSSNGKTESKFLHNVSNAGPLHNLQTPAQEANVARVANIRKCLSSSGMNRGSAALASVSECI